MKGERNCTPMMRKFVIVSLALTLFLSLCECYVVEPGPKVLATKGEVWPKPQKQFTNDTFLGLIPNKFQFKITNYNCSLLSDAIGRYEKIITLHSQVDDEFYFQNNAQQDNEKCLGLFDTLYVDLSEACTDNEIPFLDMKEDYHLKIDGTIGYLNSTSIWGILRGLETFSQLIYVEKQVPHTRLNTTSIWDYPRFSHRGILLDTSRHFIPLDVIFTTLDAMAYNKFNVFHWHLVDDQSFPYVSKKYPELSEKGAYKPSLIYSPDDVQKVIEYARLRGIRVIPEFDTPGHTRSWGVAYPEILTECEGDLAGKFGPMDPTKNVTYELVQGLFGEVGQTFPDEYIHLGGDEVEFECWSSNANVTSFMQEHNITSFKALENYYIQKIIDMVDGINSSAIVWEEVFLSGASLPANAIVQVWKDSWEVTMLEVIMSGKRVLLSSCWYLDYLETGGDWRKFYTCQVPEYTAPGVRNELILGGEACMWSESVNEFNIISRMWPRASATAEKLWSQENCQDIDEAAKRLEEHTCRLNGRGVGAQPPNGPGFCT